MVEVVSQPVVNRREELRVTRQAVVDQYDEERSVAELAKIYRDVLA